MIVASHEIALVLPVKSQTYHEKWQKVSRGCCELESRQLAYPFSPGFEWREYFLSCCFQEKMFPTTDNSYPHWCETCCLVATSCLTLLWPHGL